MAEKQDDTSLDALFPGEGEMARRMRMLDWSQTELGPPETWPESLRLVVRHCLASPEPMALRWGEKQTLLYNDAYIPKLQPGRHPACLAQPGGDYHAALRASEAKFSAAFDQSPLALTITTVPEGRLVNVNEGFLRLSGYRRDQVIGRTIDELKLWVEPARRAEGLARLRGGDRIYGAEAKFRLPNGEERLCLIGSTLIEIDSRPHVLSSVIDVTEQRRAERQLRESEEGFRTLVGQVKDYAIFRIDLDSRPTSWNEGVRHVLGYEEHEFIGTDITTAIFTPEDVAADVPAKELRTAIDCGSASNDRWMRRKDGTRFYAGGMTTALRDPAGEVVGFTKVMRDLTDRKLAEERKDEFLAMLAHELRNPLAPIKSACRVMAKLALNDERLMRARDIIERQTDHLTRMVEDLLDVSRVTRGKIELRREPTQVAAVIDSAVETARPLIDQMGHTLHVSSPDRELRVDGDFARLVQVVSNLLINAAKFTPAGGEISVSSERIAEQAVIRVRDTGIGISPEQQTRIFELFIQEDQSLARTRGGLGIGLTLVKRLLELHRGWIEVRSQGEGHGSEFIVHLPVSG